MNKSFEIQNFFQVPNCTLLSSFLNSKVCKSDLPFDLFERFSNAAGMNEPVFSSKIHVMPHITRITFVNPRHLPEEIILKEKPGTHIDGALLMPNGDIVFNFQYCGLIRLNPCGSIVWRLGQAP